MPGERSKLKGMADGLDKGAGFLENDGSDGKTLAHLVPAAEMPKGSDAALTVASAPTNGATMKMNRDSRAWNDHTVLGDLVVRWAIGHESFHSAGFSDLEIGLNKAYRLAPRGSFPRRTFDFFTPLPESANNPDHMMCEVYCAELEQLAPNW